jgi:CubicO group peptidase (beta-lactamase class C family)
MKPLQYFKIAGMLIAAIGIIFLIYSLIPRVGHSRTSYATPLEKSAVLPHAFQQKLRTFITDTASRMQNVIIVHNGEIIFEEGNTSKLINCHSARKSVMSLLIGIAQDKGLLSLDETLADLGIDESKTPLTTTEKSATIRDLLMCTSSIFLKAEAEHDWADDIRPKRGQYQPGDFFFYNNWDFNVLGTILECKTGMSIGEFMEAYLAKPLGMEEFSAKNIVYNSPWPVPNKTMSDYPVFWMYLSARDMAKVGVLIAQNGKWNGHQVVSSDWLEESLKPYSKLGDYNGLYAPYEAFTYSWWYEGDTKTIWADGFGGQFMCIDRERNLVVIQRNFTGNSLLASGLWLMDEERDNNPKSELLYVYNKVRKQLTMK